jgi:hypothetical protein
MDVGLPTAMENVFELLRDPGHWYLDYGAQIVYYIPLPGEDMQQAQVFLV